MKTNRIRLLLFFVIINFTVCYSQGEPNKIFTKSIASHFSRLWYYAPQEKVYLHTDKPYYSAGEEIWFKAYLLNASTHRANTKSQFVYVELIDKSDSVISRVKIRKDSTGFSGNMKLAPEMSPGTYCLRAYTCWMQNTYEDFFFKKNIYIGNNIDDRIICQTSYGTPVSGKVPVTCTFTTNFNHPISDRNIKIFQNSLKTDKKNTVQTTDAKGKIHFMATLDSVNLSKKYIQVSINESGTKYKNKIYFPDFKKDFDVQFFPESGVFLNDNLQTIAFKAIGNNGLSVEVNGDVYNNKGEEISEIKSENKGMGKFMLKTNPDESYYAVLKTADGLEKKFNLPATTDKGISLRLSYNRGKILYSITNSTSVSLDSLYLLVHSRGVAYIIEPLNDIEGQIPDNILPAGINSVSVIDTHANTYCERLVFVRPAQLPAFTMNADKPTYKKREPVKLNFSVLSSTGKPMEGNFSISVTDKKFVVSDTISDNIESYLLLSSDIKGYIENPASYFVDNSNITREKTDILMMTQGWRRFNTADYVKGKYKVPEYYLEAGQTVSGKVLNLFEKPVKNSDVILLSQYKNRISVAKTDSNGHFLIDGIEFPDSTNIILKAKSKTKIVDVELVADVDEFPAANTFIPYIGEKKPNDAYFQQSREKYYTEGGMMFVNLDEITVKAEAKKSNSMTDYYSSLADRNITEEKIEENPGLGVLDLLSMEPGIEVNGQEISIRGAGSPLFIVDGIETQNIEDVLYLNSFDIENIAIMKGASTTMFGSKGGNGVIAITLKKGVVRKAMTPPSLLHISPLGYQKPVAFYVPKYEVDSVRKLAKSDLRTTIYWNPKLKTDSTGTFTVKFWTADKQNDYSVNIEGISKTGEICRYVGILKRKDE